MIAAVYARKSTDQSAIVDEAKSVTRQIEHARAYATRKGWTVPRRASSWTTGSPAPSSTSHVARALHVSEVYVRQLARSGRLPSTLLSSGQRIFQPSDVETLHRERSAAAGR